MMIDLGDTEIFKRELFQTLDSIFNADLPIGQ